MSRDLRILLVNSSSSPGDEVFHLMNSDLAEKIDLENSGRGVVLNRNLLDYNVAVIDASDNVIERKSEDNGETSFSYRSLTDFLRLRNPDMIIIGTSIFGENFRGDNYAKEVYDEYISISDFADFPEQITNVLKKYHLLKEEVGVK